NALNAGKEVITHTDAVSVPGWTGAGYIINDPVKGDGAYKISGGGNGGSLIPQGVGAIAIGAIGIISTALGFTVAPIIIAIALSLGIHILVLELIFNPDSNWEDVKSVVLTQIGIVVGL